MTTLIDTSAFLAIVASGDEFHEAAVATWRSLILDDEALICNNYILVETLTLIQRRRGMDAARAFHAGVLPSVSIRWVTEELHSRAMAALLAADRRYLSLVDCAAFETMRQEGVERVFTFDPHYAEFGFVTIPR